MFHLRQVLSILTLSAACGFSQVNVAVGLDQPEYLVGEPIFVVVAFTNTGKEPLGYSTCDGRADLSVAGGQLKQSISLRGCYESYIGRGGGCGLDHPPLMKPGETVSFRYLLKGYRLPSGSYSLRATGRAGVRWFFGAGRNVSSVSERKVGDSVDGAAFDTSLALHIKDGTEDELRRRYVRYVEEALSGSGLGGPSRQAREAISEMAPPFLEKTMLRFAEQPETAGLAVEGLAQIPTRQARAALIQLYDKSADLQLRTSIVEKMAEMATPEEIPFLSSLLPGRGTTLDDRLRMFAALGLGGVGGKEAVRALEPASSNSSREVRNAVAKALGLTASTAAVPILIRMYADEAARNSVCPALATLTHHAWCDGSGAVAESQTKWRAWWRKHASGVKAYGTDQCTPLSSLLREFSAMMREAA